MVWDGPDGSLKIIFHMMIKKAQTMPLANLILDA